MSKGPEKEGREPDDRDPLLIAFGERVREFRVKAGMTQKQLGVKAETSQAYIYMVESGAQNLGVSVMLRIAEALEVSPSELLPEIPNSPPSDLALMRVANAYEEATKEFREFRKEFLERADRLERNLDKIKPAIGQLSHFVRERDDSKDGS